MESRKLIPGWKLDQDSRLRAQVAPTSKQEGAESWTGSYLDLSKCPTAHKQEDKLHLEQERWLSRQNGNKTLVRTSLCSDKGIICW